MVSLIIFLVVGIYTRRVKQRRIYVMALATLPPFVGMLGMALLPNTPHYKWSKWFLYLITVPYVLSLFLAWTLIPSNVAGRTKKTVISSATFVGYVSAPPSSFPKTFSSLTSPVRRQHGRKPNLQDQRRSTVHPRNHRLRHIPRRRIRSHCCVAPVLYVAE